MQIRTPRNKDTSINWHVLESQLRYIKQAFMDLNIALHVAGQNEAQTKECPRHSLSGIARKIAECEHLCLRISKMYQISLWLATRNSISSPLKAPFENEMSSTKIQKTSFKVSTPLNDSINSQQVLRVMPKISSNLPSLANEPYFDNQLIQLWSQLRTMLDSFEKILASHKTNYSATRLELQDILYRVRCMHLINVEWIIQLGLERLMRYNNSVNNVTIMLHEEPQIDSRKKFTTHHKSSQTYSPCTENETLRNTRSESSQLFLNRDSLSPEHFTKTIEVTSSTPLESTAKPSITSDETIIWPCDLQQNRGHEQLCNFSHVNETSLDKVFSFQTSELQRSETFQNVHEENSSSDFSIFENEDNLKSHVTSTSDSVFVAQASYGNKLAIQPDKVSETFGKFLPSAVPKSSRCEGGSIKQLQFIPALICNENQTKSTRALIDESQCSTTLLDSSENLSFGDLNTECLILKQLNRFPPKEITMHFPSIYECHHTPQVFDATQNSTPSLEKEDISDNLYEWTSFSLTKHETFFCSHSEKNALSRYKHQRTLDRLTGMTTNVFSSALLNRLTFLEQERVIISSDPLLQKELITKDDCYISCCSTVTDLKRDNGSVTNSFTKEHSTFSMSSLPSTPNASKHNVESPTSIQIILEKHVKARDQAMVALHKSYHSSKKQTVPNRLCWYRTMYRQLSNEFYDERLAQTMKMFNHWTSNLAS